MNAGLNVQFAAAMLTEHFRHSHTWGSDTTMPPKVLAGPYGHSAGVRIVWEVGLRSCRDFEGQCQDKADKMHKEVRRQILTERAQHSQRAVGSTEIYEKSVPLDERWLWQPSYSQYLLPPTKNVRRIVLDVDLSWSQATCEYMFERFFAAQRLDNTAFRTP